MAGYGVKFDASVISNAASAVLLLPVAYYTLLVLYRLTFHPLARFPGPFWSKISEWTVPWQCTTGDRHLLHLQEHGKYGPVVRIGPNTLSFSSPKALRQIYQSGREDNPLRKGSYYDTIDAPTGAYSLHSETSRSKHAARRRILNHGFSAAALRSNEGHLVEAVDKLCEVLGPGKGEEWSQARDMSRYFNWFAYDVMGMLVFGRQFDCMTDSTHRYVPKMIITTGAYLYWVANLPFQWLVRPLISSPKLMDLFGGQTVRQQYAYLDYATECMRARLAREDEDAGANEEDGDVKRDIMHYIIQSRNGSNANYGRKELDADASLLIAAGSDTTSTTLAGLFFYLTLPSSADAMRKLQAEVRDLSRFPKVADLTGPVTTSLPYLRACVDEALRLAPPAPGHLPRSVAHESGIEIDGHHIPAGTTVGMSTYVVHHDEQAFPDPWIYNPDRWVAGDSSATDKAEYIRRMREAFAPFSLGSRGCIGRDLAYRELCLSAARIIYLFDFRRSPVKGVSSASTGSAQRRAGMKVRDDEYQIYDCFLADRHGPEIEFRRVI